ncbi:hypothetical protein THAOC_14746 [Thalassiosira oceanica]|uniref:Uncharacterized protein n=1 Tax=Thalassiosira oceanica TaxID=159749 RepID=K0SEF2_THAOC|nr:hypothetical protein THAOC_14746 [Thalassiosira oceanica]|eukprot:EJK64513.1 hypothetical protein THAOC_14746 [Thalassiosira oceanica]
MGLGGLTRDSIVGLNNLVNNDDDENHLPQRRPPSSHDSGLPSSVPTSVSLNDEHKNAEFEAASASLSPRSSAAVAAATSYNKVSATNSRSLDSYNTSPQASTYHGFQYEGYTDYYTEDYGSYMHNDFATGNATGEDGHIFCCLFAPWIKQSKAQLEDDEEVSSGHLSPDGSASWKSGEERECDADKSDLKPPKTTQQDASSDLDEISTPPAPALKNKNGEGESSEQKAVVFSMSDGLGPEKELSPHMMSSRRSDADDMTASSTASSTSCSDDQKFAAKEEAAGPEVTKPDTLKGILKVRCRPAQSSKNQKSSGKSSKASTPESPMKRHLFPSYNPRHTQFENSDSKKDLTFNPMARVLTIPSRIDIPYAQKTQVWWQRCDYDEFKKTGRIISKAMECGGSDIWLASSNAWGMKQANQRKAPRRMSSETEYDKALSQYVGEHESDSDDDGRLDYGNKWWCKFGHSRRGLEHVVSPSEGKARQKSVQLALQKVVDEQRRQRAARTKDPNKLRNVSMQYTSWARDLAHAAGIADAEAVSSHFDQSAKTRAHYYAKKMNISQGSSIDQNGVGSGVVRAVTSSILDANTHSKKKAESTSTPVPVRRSEISLGKRAKGFMPG